jgi:hypothetical protein
VSVQSPTQVQPSQTGPIRAVPLGDVGGRYAQG